VKDLHAGIRLHHVHRGGHRQRRTFAGADGPAADRGSLRPGQHQGQLTCRLLPGGALDCVARVFVRFRCMKRGPAGPEPAKSLRRSHGHWASPPTAEDSCSSGSMRKGPSTSRRWTDLGKAVTEEARRGRPPSTAPRWWPGRNLRPTAPTKFVFRPSRAVGRSSPS